jgi:hypothetical protein
MNNKSIFTQRAGCRQLILMEKEFLGFVMLRDFDNGVRFYVED